MDLLAWRKRNNLSSNRVATAVGTSRSHIGNIEKGIKRPSPELAKKIEAFTRGEVTAATLLGLSERRNRTRGVREESAIYQSTETISVDIAVSPQQRQDLVDLGIDIESVARKGAQMALAKAHSEAWRDANKDAIDAYNAWIDKHGTLAEQLGLI